MGNFDERLALSCVYTQLKDGWGKDEYVFAFFIKIGFGDKNAPLNARAIFHFCFER